MRLVLLLPVMALLLAGCSDKKEGMTVEENVMTKAFAGFVAAGTYDSVCGGKKLAVADVKKNPDFAFYMGNRQLFGARMGALWQARHPEATVEQGVISLIETEKKIAGKIAVSLDQKGCGSDAAVQGKHMYDLYTRTHPAQINAMLDKSIEKEGGTVTPPPVPEKAETPVKKD